MGFRLLSWLNPLKSPFLLTNTIVPTLGLTRVPGYIFRGGGEFQFELIIGFKILLFSWHDKREAMLKPCSQAYLLQKVTGRSGRSGGKH